MIYTRFFNIDNSGKIDVTKDIQKVFDDYQGEDIYLDEGKYLVSNLYLKSNTNLYLDSKAYLLGTTHEENYNIIKTRVAGINMDWYPAILNIIDSKNVNVSGGNIIGAGEYFYLKYWGSDMVGGMRKDYDAKGLRWACDYDCMRVRNMLVSNSENVRISDIKLYDSPGFALNRNIYAVDDFKLIKKLNTKKMLKPITYQAKDSSSIFIEELFRLSPSIKNSLTFYMSNDLNIYRLFDSNKLLDLDYKELSIDDNCDLVIKGLGFINIKKKCTIKVYSNYLDLIEIRKAMF